MKYHSKLGVEFTPEDRAQAIEEYERHFRPDERELMRIGLFRDKQIQYIEDLYAENFKSDTKAKDRAARCGRK